MASRADLGPGYRGLEAPLPSLFARRPHASIPRAGSAGHAERPDPFGLDGAPCRTAH